MKYGKRQLILASLVLALGAAVYLNWQLADTTLPVEGETTETESSTLGAAQLVNSNYVGRNFAEIDFLGFFCGSYYLFLDH